MTLTRSMMWWHCTQDLHVNLEIWRLTKKISLIIHRYVGVDVVSHLHSPSRFSQSQLVPAGVCCAIPAEPRPRSRSSARWSGPGASLLSLTSAIFRCVLALQLPQEFRTLTSLFISANSGKLVVWVTMPISRRQCGWLAKLRASLRPQAVIPISTRPPLVQCLHSGDSPCWKRHLHHVLLRVANLHRLVVADLDEPPKLFREFVFIISAPSKIVSPRLLGRQQL